MWTRTVEKLHGNADNTDLQTSTKAKYYGISVPFITPFSSAAKEELVIQYSVKHKQRIDCDSAYIRQLPLETSLK